MKPLTNILIVAFLAVYLFLPFLNVDFDGAWTGIKYTAETVTNSSEPLKITFALIPFIAGFCGIVVNCMKNRYWGILVAAFCALGVYFYIDARELEHIQSPEFYHITSTGYGFSIGYWIMILALISALSSVLPFKINKFLARELAFLSKKKRNTETPEEAQEEVESIPQEDSNAATGQTANTDQSEEPARPEDATAPENPHAAYMPKSQPEEE